MSLLLAPVPRLHRRLARQALGLVFLAVLAGLIGLAVALYDHAFTPTVPVTLRLTSAGDQFAPPAEVKLRGIVVGEVTAVSSTGSGALVRMALHPSAVALVPANVLARVVPKTLFGEKYVDLVIPAHPSARRVYPGEVIGTDRSRAALEVATVFDHLLPLLTQVAPAQLDETLTAVATALRGQAGPLGANLAAAGAYLTRFNPHLATVDADIAALAAEVDHLAAAEPALVGAAGNFSVNAATLTAKQDTLAALLAQGLAFATTATSVLDTNATNLVALARVSTPTLGLLARFSPEFPCLAEGLTALEPRLDQVFGPGPELHITLQDVPDRGGYTSYPADLPTLTQVPDTGPNCYGLPAAPQNNVYPGQPSAGAAATSPVLAQQAQVDRLVRLMQGPSTPVSSLDTLLLGPLLAGARVSLS